MTKVIVAQNCPRCGAEPVAYTSKHSMGTCIHCPDKDCIDNGMKVSGATVEDATIEWNKVKA